ncbi:MAG: hypothetical protein PGN11_01730 [Quadrisphaera sp.]
MDSWWTALLDSDLSGVLLGGLLTLFGGGLTGLFGLAQRRAQARDDQRREERAAVQRLVFLARTNTAYLEGAGKRIPEDVHLVEEAMVAAQLTVKHQRVRPALTKVIEALESEPLGFDRGEWAAHERAKATALQELLASAADTYA